MNIAVTGGSGYVGGALVEAGTARGHEVTVLGRTRVPGRWRHYELAAGPEPGALDGIDVLVHAAYDLSLTDPDEVARVNVTGTRRLADACAAAGVRLVLVSSMSAYEGTSQTYGRAKLASEQDVARTGGLAVRLGLVYGGEPGGMAGALSKATVLPVLPLIGARSHQFVVHVDDMSQAMLAAIEAEAGSASAVGLAHPEPVEFRTLVLGLAAAAGRRTRVVPVPWQPVYAGMRAAERLGITLPLRSDSVLGLVRPAPFVPQPDFWDALDAGPGPFDPARL